MGTTSGGGRARALPRLLLWAPAAALALACHACAPDPADREPPSRSTAAPGTTARTDTQDDTHDADGPRMPTDPDDSLQLRIEAPESVARGQTVPFTFRIRNVTDRTLTLHLTGREIAFDIVVERADGSAVWRRLEGEVVRSILRLDTLPPGEALVLDATWDQHSTAGPPVPPGEYRVRGELLTEGEPLRSPNAPLRITPSP